VILEQNTNTSIITASEEKISDAKILNSLISVEETQLDLKNHE